MKSFLGIELRDNELGDEILDQDNDNLWLKYVMPKSRYMNGEKIAIIDVLFVANKILDKIID